MLSNQYIHLAALPKIKIISSCSIAEKCAFQQLSLFGNRLPIKSKTSYTNNLNTFENQQN